MAKLQTLLYTAENSLEMRLKENISIRAFRRMRRVLTEVRDAVTGKWAWAVLAEPPKHRSAGGTDSCLTEKCNAQQGIYPKRPVYAPAPIADDHAMRAVAEKLLGNRKMAVAVPSKDGFASAAPRGQLATLSKTSGAVSMAMFVRALQ